MGQESEFGFVLLAVSLAHLAADVTRWALEPPPRPAINASIAVQKSADKPDPYRQRPGIERDGPPAVQKAQGSGQPVRERGRDRPEFSRLPIDFSINRPPWCVVCRRLPAPL